MKQETLCSVVIPMFNEEEHILKALTSLAHQLESGSDVPLNPALFEIIVVDNNSTDNTLTVVNLFASEYPEINLILHHEKNQGVAWARKSGMDLAVQRSLARDRLTKENNSFYIFSTDADCYVNPYWIDEQLQLLKSTKAALSVCNYYYPKKHFNHRPSLARVMNLILDARDKVMRIFGGFPDGKGFAVAREKYQKVKGIEIFYQLSDGKFVCHLSDDWDFGIKIRASGEEIVYCPNAKVWTNPRRVDHALDEMVRGVAYGSDGIITMRDIRVKQKELCDLTNDEADLLFSFSIKDFITKHIILPILLTPSSLKRSDVKEFLTSSLCEKLFLRVQEIMDEMSVNNFIPIHSYKTPCFRLYFEFREILFERLRMMVGDEIGYPPPLPDCLNDIQKNDPSNFLSFVYYYCEDRESGEAHNYFGNGGVF